MARRLGVTEPMGQSAHFSFRYQAPPEELCIMLSIILLQFSTILVIWLCIFIIPSPDWPIMLLPDIIP
jgi:hypothetical protein